MPETTLRGQRSTRFPKYEKSVIFGILAMKIFWKAQILYMAGSENTNCTKNLDSK